MEVGEAYHKSILYNACGVVVGGFGGWLFLKSRLKE
jgi:hypothetical protein